MITYFRGNYPSRLVWLFVVFVALQAMVLYAGMPLTRAVLQYQLLGERLANGFGLYREAFTGIAPLSAFVFWLIDLVAGRSVTAYTVLAGLLVLLQALRLNLILNKNKVHAEKSYLPAVVYLLLGSMHFEMHLLSPVLLGLTFMVFSLHNITTFSKEANNTRKLFKGGLLIGLAALCYQPLGWYLLLAFVATIFFASDLFRSLLLLLCGFLFPFACAATYFLYTNGLVGFGQFYLPPAFTLQQALVPPSQLLVLLLPFLLVLVAALPRLYTEAGSLNYRFRFQQLMVLWLLVSVPVIATGEAISVKSFMVLLPAVAYFAGQAFAQRKPRWLTETASALVLAGVFFTALYYPLFTGNILPDKLLVKAPVSLQIKGKRVLVLGNAPEYYVHNQPVTAFYEWPTAAKVLVKPQTYSQISTVYLHFNSDPPEVIIDAAGVMPQVLEYIPLLAANYRAYPLAKGKVYYARSCKNCPQP